MRFIVTRTSQWETNIAPCKGAKRVDGFLRDVRNAKTIGEIAVHWPDPKAFERDWSGGGFGHGTYKGHIFRWLPRAEWVIDIDSLEALLKFVGKHGEIVLGPHYMPWHEATDQSPLPRIEIYDGYRE